MPKTSPPPPRSASSALRFRQVHLDFHTSGEITRVGEKFSEKNFQAALLAGRVDSVTLFAKCHHGWSYHDTKVGRRHPHLRFDLLSRQIAACRAIGVRCPIYLSAGLDELQAMLHPEWVVKNRDGTTYRPLEVGWFKLLRFNSPYLDYLCRQIEEVVRRWPDNDGIFLDIIAPRPDYSESALQAMTREGLDPEKESDVGRHAQQVLFDYYRRTTAAVRSKRADTKVFHNAGHLAIGARRVFRYNSHLELESLPTGGWGYDHFPLTARYAITTGMDFLGMTGKFHTSWGEFGGFKRAGALQYECGAMLAAGAKCSIGDQLHPSGAMNPDTYRLIGEAYAQVAAKEPWCGEVRSVARVALASAEKDQEEARAGARGHPGDEGAARMLLEAHLPFVFLDERAAWTGFDLVVLPDGYEMTVERARRARTFLRGGGRLIAAGSALLTPDRRQFAIRFGPTLHGRGAFDPDYLVATELTRSVPVRTPIVIPGGAWEIEPGKAEILAERREPYFNRTWRHFCSHLHAPDAPRRCRPAAVATRAVAYFAHDLFSQYRRYGQPLYRDFFLAALDRLLPEGRPARTNLPSAGRLNVLAQPSARRYVVHLAHAATSLRGGSEPGDRPIEIIEDLVPLRGVTVRLMLPRRVRTARLVPGEIELPLAQDGQSVEFTVPELVGHQMIELSWR